MSKRGGRHGFLELWRVPLAVLVMGYLHEAC
jgi:hypothetical protein